MIQIGLKHRKAVFFGILFPSRIRMFNHVYICPSSSTGTRRSTVRPRDGNREVEAVEVRVLWVTNLSNSPLWSSPPFRHVLVAPSAPCSKEFCSGATVKLHWNYWNSTEYFWIKGKAASWFSLLGWLPIFCHWIHNFGGLKMQSVQVKSQVAWMKTPFFEVDLGWSNPKFCEKTNVLRTKSSSILTILFLVVLFLIFLDLIRLEIAYLPGLNPAYFYGFWSL